MWWKKEKQEHKEIGFEERERKTPIAGYILLIAMAIISWWLGSMAIGDLEKVPAKPQAFSACSVPYTVYGWQDAWRYSGPYYDYQTQPVYEKPAPYPSPALEGTPPQELRLVQTTCAFSELEKKYGIPAVFEQTKSSRDQINALQTQTNRKQADLNKIQFDLENFRSAYQLSLSEKIAQVEGRLYNTAELQAKLAELESQNTMLVKDIANLQAQTTTLADQLKPSNAEIQALYQKALSDWRWAWRWHEFMVFLLQALFVFPFFFGVLKLYFRLSARNSPYTVIATFLLAVASVFVIQMVCVYFWSLFLAIIIETLWGIIKESQLLRSLLSYAGMLLSIAVLGGAVYVLQKKIFSPGRVALRRLRENKCPSCQFSLKLADAFCPHCGERILEQCKKCQKMKYAHLPVCPHCGDRKV